MPLSAALIVICLTPLNKPFLNIPVECPEDFDLTVTDSAGKIVTDSLSGTAYEHDTWALSVEKTY